MYFDTMSCLPLLQLVMSTIPSSNQCLATPAIYVASYMPVWLSVYVCVINAHLCLSMHCICVHMYVHIANINSGSYVSCYYYLTLMLYIHIQ